MSSLPENIPPNIPLIADFEPARAFAWHQGRCVTAGAALGQVLALADRLVPGRAYFNLCADRFHFTLAFAAVCVAGGTNLLPASRATGALASARNQFADADVLDDDQLAAWLSDIGEVDTEFQSPRLSGTQRVAVVFTSGSTGAPVAHAKAWRDLYLGTQMCKQCFFGDGLERNIVATVPPQHMYGLETSVLTVLCAGFAAHSQCPSMPWDIVVALEEIPAPRLLITTPVHLDACLRAQVKMPALQQVISATAPLPTQTARAAEAAWNVPVYEIYGCSEAGSLASRRTAQDSVWTLYDDVHLDPKATSTVSGSQLPEPVILGDQIELLDDRRFRLLGRTQDMLKLAGKRLSLGELTQRLLAIDGVMDAVAFVPEGAQRPAALLVAPGLEPQQIAAQLAEAVDAVFVPRPLIHVPRLPRNAMGKLPRAELEALLEQHRA